MRISSQCLHALDLFELNTLLLQRCFYDQVFFVILRDGRQGLALYAVSIVQGQSDPMAVHAGDFDVIMDMAADWRGHDCCLCP